jgi:membrane protein
MKKKVFSFFSLVKQSGQEFLEDNGTKLSASLAYFTIFSIGPLLLVIITLLGKFYKKEAVTAEVFNQASELVGKSGAEQLKSMLDNISTQGNNTLFSVIGGIVLVFGATSIFTEIQSSINYIWSIKAKPKKGWLKYILDRLLSFSLVVGCGFLLLVTLFINIIMDLLNERIAHFLGDADTVLLQAVNIGLLYTVVTFLFAVIYKVLPDAKIYWKDALTGACFTGILFLIGKFLITYYLAGSKSVSSYGAASSLIILLSWVYYSSIILYFGAEFTKVYAIKHGKGITVFDTAVYIVKHETKELPNVKHPQL